MVVRCKDGYGFPHIRHGGYVLMGACVSVWVKVYGSFDAKISLMCVCLFVCVCVFFVFVCCMVWYVFMNGFEYGYFFV